MMRAFVIVFIALFIGCALCAIDCPHKRGGLVKWSDASTWGGSLPGPTQNISIPSGKSVLVDLAEITVGEVSIPADSVLIFDDTKDLTFNTTAIRVSGELWIGSSDCPFTHNLDIVLFGETSSDTAVGYGYKVLAGKPGSTVEIHGTPPGPTWVRLSKTANVNDTSITVDTAVNGWKVGDTIAIASTDFDEYQTERRVISSIDGSKKVVGFEDKLKYMHYGVSNIVDERAEVGHITRNVVIRGDLSTNSTNSTGYGGHIIMWGNLTAHISYIEVYNMGQKGVLGRYPIHFHLGMAAGRGNSLIGAAIHDNFQRCLTIHYTSNLKVSDNVAYYNGGHCYFFENGYEVNNTLTNNLGMVARVIPAATPPIIATDTEPSVFWITNPMNTFINNVAVGGKFGYWLTYPVHPIGPANTAENNITIFPQSTSITLFKGNKAHSCTEDGIFADRGVFLDNTATQLTSTVPRLFYIDPNNLPNATNFDYQAFINGVQVAPNYILDFTAYKCRSHGIWLRGVDWIVKNAIVADSLVGCNMPGNNAVLDSIFIGETDNIGNPTNLKNQGFRTRPSTTGTISGFQNYDASGPAFVLGNTFINYTDYSYVNGSSNYGKVRKSGGISGIHGPNVLSARTKYFRSTFVNVDNRVYLESAFLFNNSYPNEDSLQGEVLVDSDGGLTGTCGTRIVVNSADLYTNECTFNVNWNVWLCPPSVAHYPMFTIREVTNTVYNASADYDYRFPNAPAGAAFVHRLPDGQSRSLMVGYISGQSGVFTKSYSSHVLGNSEYAISIPFSLPNWMVVTISEVPKNNWLILALPYPKGSTFIVSTDSAQKSVLQQVSTKEQLTPTTYFYDSTNEYLWIYINVASDSYGYQYGIFYPYYTSSASIYINATCPGGVCLKSTYGLNNALLGKPVVKSYRSGEPCEVDTFQALPNIKYTPIGPVVSIFDDTLGNWTITGNAKWNYTSLISQSGVAINASFTGYQTVQFRFSKGVWVKSINNGQNLYFEASLYTSAMTGVPNPSIVQQNKNVTEFRVYVYNTTASLGPSVSVNNPFYLNSYPLTPGGWRVLRIPLNDIVTDLNSTIYRIDISAQQSFPVTMHMDDVKIVAYTSDMPTAPPQPTTSSPTGGSTTQNNDVDSSAINLAASLAVFVLVCLAML